MAMPRDRWGEAATGHRGVLRCQKERSWPVRA